MVFEKSLVNTIERPEVNGIQKIYKFDNDMGASVIKHDYSYGGDQGLWELAVTQYEGEDWHINYNTPITSDVEGYLSWEDVENLLNKISELEEGVY